MMHLKRYMSKGYTLCRGIRVAPAQMASGTYIIVLILVYIPKRLRSRRLNQSGHFRGQEGGAEPVASHGNLGPIHHPRNAMTLL
jgi:hypothetical protein